MKDDLGLTAFTEGFVVSVLIFGAAFGALIGGRLADRHGRRHNIRMLAGIFAIGTLGCVFSPSWPVLAFFRFVLGLAVGGASATVPVYLAEVSPYEKRGSLVTRNEPGDAGDGSAPSRQLVVEFAACFLRMAGART